MVNSLRLFRTPPTMKDTNDTLLMVSSFGPRITVYGAQMPCLLDSSQACSPHGLWDGWYVGNGSRAPVLRNRPTANHLINADARAASVPCVDSWARRLLGT